MTHSLTHFYTASSDIPNFPEFVFVGMVDGVQMVHYDSNIQKVVPEQDWMKQTDAEFCEKERENLFYSQQSFKAEVATLKQHFNQSGGKSFIFTSSDHLCLYKLSKSLILGDNN